MVMVWPCPLSVDAYVAAGREVEFPRPGCPSCGGRLVLWSGYRRHVRVAGRCQRIFVPRLRCAGCRVTSCAAAGVRAGLAAGRSRGRRRGNRAGSWRRRAGVRPAAARLGVPYTTARGWVRRFGARGPELGVAFAALAVELGGERCPPGGGARRVRVSRDWRGVRRGRRAAGVAGGGGVAVRVGGDRREADRRQHNLALSDRRQTAFHASCPAITGMRRQTAWTTGSKSRSRCTAGR